MQLSLIMESGILDLAKTFLQFLAWHGAVILVICWAFLGLHFFISDDWRCMTGESIQWYNVSPIVYAAFIDTVSIDKPMTFLYTLPLCTGWMSWGTQIPAGNTHMHSVVANRWDYSNLPLILIVALWLGDRLLFLQRLVDCQLLPVGSFSNSFRFIYWASWSCQSRLKWAVYN